MLATLAKVGSSMSGENIGRDMSSKWRSCAASVLALAISSSALSNSTAQYSFLLDAGSASMLILPSFVRAE